MIKIGIVGIGNCCSSLVQGIYYCRDLGEDAVGVIHQDIGGYRPEHIQVVAAWDIDKRKVGVDLSQAIWQAPNCTASFYPRVPESGVTVEMGAILDGIADGMRESPESRAFVPANLPQPDVDAVVATLRQREVEVLINFLPVGSEQAAKFYAECALQAGVALVNAIPVFIASDPEWADRFRARGVPIVGDDFKAQLGATITHRVLSELFRQRGVRLNRTYQLNVGGNTDFLNMQDKQRLDSKRESKTEAVQATLSERLSDEQIRIGPSDYVPWLNDNKVAYIRMEGALLGGVPMNLELRLSVEDSPNAAAIALDAIRCARLALDRGIAGPLLGPAAAMCKHPPVQMPEEEALRIMQAFFEGGDPG